MILSGTSPNLNYGYAIGKVGLRILGADRFFETRGLAPSTSLQLRQTCLVRRCRGEGDGRPGCWSDCGRIGAERQSAGFGVGLIIPLGTPLVWAVNLPVVFATLHFVGRIHLGVKHLKMYIRHLFPGLPPRI
jgi:hypothetical protein